MLSWLNHALHTLLTSEKNGYYQDLGATQDLVIASNVAYV